MLCKVNLSNNQLFKFIIVLYLIVTKYNYYLNIKYA